MIEEVVLVETFDQKLKPSGFRKSKRNFYRFGQSLYSVLNLQHSQLYGAWFVNFGFSPLTQADGKFLPENKCMVRFRAESVSAISRGGCALLDDDSDSSDPLWEGSLIEKVVVPAVELLEAVRDAPTLAAVLKMDVTSQVFIHKDFRSILNSES